MPDRDTHSQDLYRLAIEEGIRAVQQQEAELGRIRDRTINLLGLVATATAFFVGAALQSDTRGPRFYLPLGLGTALFLALAYCSWDLLKPVEHWKAKVSSTVLIEDFASRPAAESYALLASFYTSAKDSNDAKLNPLRNKLRTAVALSGAVVLAWIALVWSVAG